MRRSLLLRWSLLAVAALSLGACKKKDGDACRRNGDCDADLVCMNVAFLTNQRSHVCVPAKAGRAPACAAAIWCVEGGQCSLMPGNGADDTASCVAANDADCKGAGDCKKKGECRASGGKCVR
jgi:hypothetical protein